MARRQTRAYGRSIHHFELKGFFPADAGSTGDVVGGAPGRDEPNDRPGRVLIKSGSIVRFAPKATELLRRREMSRCAHKQTIVGTREKLREPMRQKRMPRPQGSEGATGVELHSCVHNPTFKFQCNGLLRFALERMAYSHQNS